MDSNPSFQYFSDPEIFKALIEMSSELAWIREIHDEKVVWVASKENQIRFDIPDTKVGQDFWYSRIHPKDKKQASALFQSNLNDPNATSFIRKYRFKSSNDKWRYIRDKVRFIRNAKGVAVRAIGVWEDITEVVVKQKKAKKLLVDLEKDKNRFRIISELSNAVMWEEDMKTDQLYWTADDKILEDFGLNKRNFPVADWVNYIHPDDCERSAKRFKDAITSKDGIYKDEYRVIKADGSIAYIIDRGFIVKDKNNSPVSAIGGWVDVTRERIHQQGLEKYILEQEELNKKLSKREEELATSEEELRLLNTQLSMNNQVLMDRDLVITKLQHLAKMGSWEYNPNNEQFIASPEAFAIHDLDQNYPLRVEELIQFYDEEGKKLLTDILMRGQKGEMEPFDLILKSSTIHGKIIWLRLCAWTSPNKEGLPSIVGLTYDITQFKETEILLKNSEEKFSSAFHNNPDLMILMRKQDLVIIDINSKIHQVLGYDRHELIGEQATSYKFFAHQSDREYFFSHYNEVDYLEMEAELLRKNGTHIHGMVSISTFEFGGAPHIIMVIKDISDRKVAEEKFAKVFYNNPDAMMLIRKEDMVMVDINEKTLPVTGYERADFLGKSISEFNTFVHEHEREAFWHEFNRQQKVEVEMAWRKKDGRIIPVLISMEQLEISNVEHLIVIIRDISDRKIAEEKFSKIFYSNPDPMVLVRREDLVIIDVNEKCFDLIGYKREELIGKVTTDLNLFVNPREKDAYWGEFNANLEVHMDAEWQTRDGHVIQVFISMEQLDLGGTQYLIVIIKDISQLKIAEEKFSKIFYNNPDAMMLIRKEDMVMVDVNESSMRVTGYSKSEFLNRPIWDFDVFVFAHEREAFWKKFEANLKAETEASWRKKGGQIIQISLSMEQLEIGGVDHIIAMVKDISDRKIAEERFTKAFDLSPDLMMIFRERDLVLVECNKNVESVSGYKKAEIIGKSSLEFELWANPDDGIRYREEYFNSGNSVFMESVFLKKDKSTFQGNILSKRIILQNEDHMLVVVRDITQRKLAEQKVIESEANLYAVINNSNLFIWSVDPDGKLIKANKTFENYISDTYHFNVAQGELIEPADQELDEYLSGIWRPRYNRALAGEKFKITEKYEGRHVEFFISPIIDHDQMLGVVVIGEDITERVEQEMQLKEALNKVVEFKLMALRSVMNPHFFFNALSSIQYFIAQNDRKNAINYLSTFSRLVRGILEHSVSNSITLAEEIEQLKNYVVLEQLRFEDKFEFEISVDEALDLQGTEIPSLLIQPFVENAIIHGLYNKESHGILSISIKKERNAILFQVTDNGVGREVASQLRENSRPGHKSMGTAITEERLRLINNQYKVSFETIDLMNKNGTPEGTTVKIWLKN